MIFDTNIHITVNEKWDNKIKTNRITDILKNYKKNKLKGFCAVGIDNIGGYDHQKFIKITKKFKFIHPVAGFNLSKNIKKEIKLIKRLGFKSIKIHPRSKNLTLEQIDLEKIARYADEEKLNILICTYFNSHLSRSYSQDPKYILVKSLKKIKGKVVLMHGGCERLLEFAEMIRFNENFFLDLSLTLMKYKYSSIDHNIKYLFNNFDKKIMLGSDWPEIKYKNFLTRVKFFSKGLNKSKKSNIFYKNAMSVFKI